MMLQANIDTPVTWGRLCYLHLVFKAQTPAINVGVCVVRLWQAVEELSQKYIDGLSKTSEINERKILTHRQLLLNQTHKKSLPLSM